MNNVKMGSLNAIGSDEMTLDKLEETGVFQTMS